MNASKATAKAGLASRILPAWLMSLFTRKQKAEPANGLRLLKSIVPAKKSRNTLCWNLKDNIAMRKVKRNHFAKYHHACAADAVCHGEAA